MDKDLIEDVFKNFIERLQTCNLPPHMKLFLIKKLTKKDIAEYIEILNKSF